LKTHQLHLLFWWNESLLHSCDPQPFSSLIVSYTNIKCLKFSFIINDLIINLQYHKIWIKFMWKIIKNMSMQNPWVSKCKNDMKYIYIWCVFFIYDVLMWSMYDLHFN
jgi:hypothetical protein